MSLSINQLEELKSFCCLLAEKSAEVILPLFESELEVTFKSDKSPVTMADQQAELTIRELITKKYPTHGIIGEEFGSVNPDAEFVWVLDPIDGTISFTHGCPLFGTMICLKYQGKPLLGLVNQPVLNQLIIGDGKTTTFNNKIVNVRQCDNLADATVLSTDIVDINKYQSKPAFDNLISQSRIFRTWGDCYGYMMLARGYADVMFDPIMNFWDIQALIPIIEGAGGIITAWDGSPAQDAESSVASNKKLHPLVIELLNS